jgi:hypothetical protein
VSVSEIFELKVSSAGCVTKPGSSKDFGIPTTNNKPENSTVSCLDLPSTIFTYQIDEVA